MIFFIQILLNNSHIALKIEKFTLRLLFKPIKEFSQFNIKKVCTLFTFK